MNRLNRGREADEELARQRTRKTSSIALVTHWQGDATRVDQQFCSRLTRKSTTRSNGSNPNAAATDGRRFEFALMS